MVIYYSRDPQGRRVEVVVSEKQHQEIQASGGWRQSGAEAQVKQQVQQQYKEAVAKEQVRIESIKAEAIKAGKTVLERPSGEVIITDPVKEKVQRITAAAVAAATPRITAPEIEPKPSLPLRPEIIERYPPSPYIPRAVEPPPRLPPAYRKAERIYEEAGPAGQFAFGVQTLLTGKGRELIGAIPARVLPPLPTPPTPKDIPSLVKPEYPFELAERLYVPRELGFVPTKTPKEVIVESLAEILGKEFEPIRVKEAPRVKGVLPSEIEAMLGPSPPAIELAGTAFEAGVVEFFKSPVFELELAALAGVGFIKLAAMDIAGKLITTGIAKSVITVPAAVTKAVPYGIGLGITALKLSEAEMLKAAGRPEAALGGMLTFLAAIGVAGLGAKWERKYLIAQELKKYTTALELGEVEFAAKVGRVRAEAVIFKEGKPLTKAELRTAFQITEPGKPFQIITAAKVTKLPKVTGAEVQKFIGLGKGKIIGPGFLRITDRGITITRKGVMGIAETYLFGKEFKLLAGAEVTGITITEKGLYKSVAEVAGLTKEGIPFKHLGISLITKKAPIIDYYPKEIRPVPITKPFAPPAVTATLEATTKQIAATIGTAAVPKTPAGVGVLAGSIAAFLGRAERITEEKAVYPARLEEGFPKTELAISPWARKKKLLVEEEVYIPARAREVAGVQALATRQRAATMQQYGLTQKSMVSTMQQLGVRQAVMPRELLGIGVGVGLTQKQIQQQRQRQRQLQIQAQKQAHGQALGFMLPTMPITRMGIPILLPKRKKRIPRKRRVVIPGFRYREIIHPFPSLEALIVGRKPKRKKARRRKK